MDFTYPLPPANLHKRYDPIFAAFKRGQSCTLIGLPQSARSGYLKFILEYSQDFLAEFIDPKIYHFIVIENSVSGDQIVQVLAAKVLALNILLPASQVELEKRLQIHDPHLTLVSLQSGLIQIYPQHKLIIILYETEKILGGNPQAIQFLTQLWNTNRNQPNSQIHLCFIGSPILLEMKQKSIWLPLRPALEETLVEFSLFDKDETNYLRCRLENLSGQKISDTVHKLASQLSGGHTILYRLLSAMDLEELEELNTTHSHPAINELVMTIWESLTTLQKQNGPYPVPLLPPTAKNEPIDLGIILTQLTAQQKMIFDYLVAHPEQVVSRDEIAQVIWGKLWQEKYSDWAIDRCMSNLKRNLTGSPYSILTLRNRGYKYVVK